MMEFKNAFMSHSTARALDENIKGILPFLNDEQTARHFIESVFEGFDVDDLREFYDIAEYPDWNEISQITADVREMNGDKELEREYFLFLIMTLYI